MAARIITVAQQKGGAGKTTLAVHLAVAWAGGRTRVALVDSDPQGSLAAWSQIRETAPKQHADVHLSQVSGWRVSTELDRLKDGFDILVIDTPPHAETEARNAIRTADLVLVPVQPSGMDVWATGATTEMARKERTPLLAVLNRVPPRSRLVDTARAMLGDAGVDVATAPVGNRVAFAASMMEGLGVTESEPSGAAAGEILALAAGAQEASEMNAAALALHQLAAIVWVGGMVFAYTVLRPAVPGIEPPPERLKLWARVFERFFIAVWISVAVLPATGFWLVMTVWGGMATTPIYVHLMLGLYLIMLVIWLTLYFRPYARFTAAVAEQNWDAARPALDGIRKLVFVNMKLGLLIAIIAAGGRYW